MRRLLKLSLALVAAVTFVAGMTTTASAQSTANATANVSATVVGIAPLTATTVNDLDFGTVNGGTAGTVADVDGARFQITGEPNFPVNITFALPSNLVGPGAPVPITFAITDGLLWGPFPTASTPFNPNAVFNTNIDGTGFLEIGIKGTVNPALTQVSGVYTSTLTVTVAY